MPPLSNTADYRGGCCFHCRRCPSPLMTGGGSRGSTVPAIILHQQLGEGVLPLPSLSVTADIWRSQHCHCYFRRTLPTTGGAVANNWGSRRCCCPFPFPPTTGSTDACWSRCCYGPSPPTTGGGIRGSTISTIVCHRRLLGETLFPMPPSSVFANAWGSRHFR